jgi:uncharacterized OB-fold protein
MTETATAPVHPLPEIDEDSRPFWESCQREAMAIQRCAACAAFRFPPRPLCPQCLSAEVDWVPVSGRGTVYSSITMYHGYGKFWSQHVPYNLSIVELAEGPRMWTNVTGLPPDDVQVGMPVQLYYDKVSEALTLPKFRPA